MSEDNKTAQDSGHKTAAALAKGEPPQAGGAPLSGRP